MLNDSEFESLTKKFPCLQGKGPTAKLIDTLRDQLKPSDLVTFAGPVQVAAGPALVCITKDDVHLLWSQKLFFFFKFPAVQTLHRAHLKLEQEDCSVHLWAGEEENRLTFQTTLQASEFCELARG